MKYVLGNSAAFSIMIMMNALANALPINGKTTAELSNQYPNLFVPAGITFSIWGVIYLSLLIVMVAQFFLPLREVIKSLRWLVVINFLLNALWIIFWHYEYVSMSLLIMIALLTTLVLINKILQDQKGWFIRFAFGIYLGWICLATIANTTALLVSLSWEGFGISQETWTITLILIGVSISVFTMYRLKNPFLALSLCWGFYGIVLKREIDYPSIAVVSYICIAISLGAGLLLMVKQPNQWISKV